MLADEASSQPRPVYRGGPGAAGALAAPPELARQPPFREEGLSKMIREASERFTRLPQELFGDASERMPKDGGCVIS